MVMINVFFMLMGPPIVEQACQQPLQRAAEFGFAHQAGDGEQEREGQGGNNGQVHGRFLLV
jgi:hypothetical protein